MECRIIEMDSPASAVPSRSRLYGLTPRGAGTSLVESLTSYINRLAWTYRIDPRMFIAQEIFPHLSRSHHIRISPDQLGRFCQEDVKTINGAGEAAADWSHTLERLTKRSDIQSLSLRQWARGFSSVGLLSTSPAWCPICYDEWRREGSPIYQPLQWTLQITAICFQHRKRLERHCPKCQKKQPFILAQTRPGHCARCNCWLGRPLAATEDEIDDDLFDKLQWIVKFVEVLRQTVISSGTLPWEGLPVGISSCIEIFGGARLLARRAGVSHVVFQRWRSLDHKPALSCIADFCYALGISPLQLLANDLVSLKGDLKDDMRHCQPSPKRKHYVRVERERAFALIQAVLFGREAMLSVRSIERRLGCNQGSLVYHFPHECALITAQYRAYCTQRSKLRVQEMCDEVRQATLALSAQGVFPSLRRVAARLSHPSMMRTKEAKAICHSTRRELGFE